MRSLTTIWHRKGFCRSIPAFHGAQEGIQALRDAGHEVYFVTTAMHTSEHWMWERYQWLRAELGARVEDLIFAADKRLVVGDLFVDDKPANVLGWQQCHNGRSVLWEQPWNRSAVYSSASVRTRRWEDVLRVASDMR